MNYCSKCGNLNKEEHKFCTKCGTEIVAQVEEETIVNDSQSNQNKKKKENIPNYDKIGGFLIFIGIVLILGLIGTLTSFNENYTNEYYESLSTLYKNNNELFTLLNISYYLTLICLFFLILLNISFFTKSNITKKLAITYFTLLIITDIYGVFIFSDNKEIMSKLSIEIIKISFQIVSALLFIIYFSISKRVKETFIEERNFGLHFVISIILPIILFFYYSNKLNEIKYKLSTNDSSFSKTTTTSNSEINPSIQKSSTNTEIKQSSDINKNTFQSIFEYKDWKIESLDNLFKMSTNGKVNAIGHEFGIIKLKDDCKSNYAWLTFSTIHNINQYIGEEVMFKITIDKDTLYQKIPIYDVRNITQTLNIVTFSNIGFNDYALSLLKKGSKIKIEVSEKDKLYNKFDIKFEEFSLDGFVANYMKLDEKCSSSSNKIQNTYLEGRNDNKVINFLVDYIDYTNKGYIGKLEEFYANEIKSFSNANYSKEKVFKDKKDYFKRWDIVQVRLLDIESIDKEDNTENYIIKYNIEFLVYNTRTIKGIRGKALNTLVLNNNMKIIEEQQSILNKNKFTNPNELLNGFFVLKESSNKNNIIAKTIISNYQIGEGEFPQSLLIINYKDNYLNFYESDFYLNSIEYLDESKMLLKLTNNTTERNYVFDLEKNSSFILGDGNTELIKYGEYKGFFKVTSAKTYLLKEDGSSEGAHWYDAIKDSNGKIVKFLSKNTSKCVSVKRLMNGIDTQYLQQSLNECIYVEY